MREAQFDVGANLLDMFFRVVGDEPAPIRLVCDSFGFLLHLARVVNGNLVLCRKRQRGPDARIGHGAVAVRVIRDFDLDGALNRCRVAARRFRALFHSGQKLVAIERVALARGADEPVASTARVLRRNWPARADVDGHRLVRAIIDSGVARAVIRPLIADQFFFPEMLNQVNGFAQPRQTFFGLRPFGVGHGDLIERFAGAHAQNDPIWCEDAQRRKRLRDDGRLIAKCRRQNAGSQDNTLGALPSRAQPGKREGRVAVGVSPGLKVIADPGAIEAELLSLNREVKQLAWSKLLCRSLVSQLQGMVAHDMPCLSKRRKYMGAFVAPGTSSLLPAYPQKTRFARRR